MYCIITIKLLAYYISYDIGNGICVLLTNKLFKQIIFNILCYDEYKKLVEIIQLLFNISHLPICILGKINVDS